jgi:hypothetical protein
MQKQIYSNILKNDRMSMPWRNSRIGWSSMGTLRNPPFRNPGRSCSREPSAGHLRDPLLENQRSLHFIHLQGIGPRGRAGFCFPDFQRRNGLPSRTLPYRFASPLNWSAPCLGVSIPSSGSHFRRHRLPRRFGKIKVEKMVRLVPPEVLLKESGDGRLFHRAGKLGLRWLEEGEFFTAVFS